MDAGAKRHHARGENQRPAVQGLAKMVVECADRAHVFRRAHVHAHCQKERRSGCAPKDADTLTGAEGSGRKSTTRASSCKIRQLSLPWAAERLLIALG